MSIVKCGNQFGLYDHTFKMIVAVGSMKDMQETLKAINFEE